MGTPPERSRSSPAEAPPEITVTHQKAERETLAAIAQELTRPTVVAPPRAKLDTLGYEERPRAARSALGSSPELITIEDSPIGRSTHHAIQQELGGELGEEEQFVARATKDVTDAVVAPADIFEIFTFVVQGNEIYSKASEASRRAFVADRLLHRLPVSSIEQVVRIDLSRGPVPRTMILRVWTKVAPRVPPADA